MKYYHNKKLNIDNCVDVILICVSVIYVEIYAPDFLMRIRYVHRRTETLILQHRWIVKMMRRTGTWVVSKARQGTPGLHGYVGSQLGSSGYTRSPWVPE